MLSWFGMSGMFTELRFASEYRCFFLQAKKIDATLFPLQICSAKYESLCTTLQPTFSPGSRTLPEGTVVAGMSCRTVPQSRFYDIIWRRKSIARTKQLTKI